MGVSAQNNPSAFQDQWRKGDRGHRAEIRSQVTLGFKYGKKINYAVKNKLCGKKQIMREKKLCGRKNYAGKIKYAGKNKYEIKMRGKTHCGDCGPDAGTSIARL